MNFPIKLPGTAILLLVASGSLTADPLPEQMTFIPWTGGNWKSEWPGVIQRTYFYQWSSDLVTWHFAPFMAFGTGGHEYFMASSPGKLFVRLHSIDAEWVTTLQQARDADFDSDGIPSWFEVEELQSNPLDRNSNGGDSNTNGLSDGWERYYFGGLGIANPNLIQSGDGLTNKEKSALGLDPDVNYSSPGAVQKATHSYDLVGRLTNITAPLTSATFSYDEEGNILNAQ